MSITTVGITVHGEGSIAVNEAYIEYIASAGYEPILITQYSDIDFMQDACDALLLPGGGDIDPMYYGDDNLASYNVDPHKDAFERRMLYAFLGNKKPVFGICRGFQMICRELILPNDDMIYYQHVNGHSQTGDNKAARYVPTHSVVADIELLYGNRQEKRKTGKIGVNSMHHQAVVIYEKSALWLGSSIKDIDGDECFITALSQYSIPSRSKAIVEGICIPGKKVAAVQWHPEELDDTELLHCLFEERVK